MPRLIVGAEKDAPIELYYVKPQNKLYQLTAIFSLPPF